MRRSILAVVAGYAVIGLLVVATDAIAAAVIPRFRIMTAPPLKYLITTLFTDSTYTVSGGYLCARIASASARGTTIGLIVFGELMGIVSAIVSWAMQPHWFAIALLILYPIAVWIGYVIARRAPQGSQSARAAG